MREHRARQCLVDRAIQHLVQRLGARLLQVLAHAIEDDDRIVERIADDREQRGHDRERDLQAHDREERERAEEIVERRQNGREAEAPLEAEGEVEQRDEERDDDGDDGVATQLIADAGADDLGAHDLRLRCAELPVQGCLDLARRLLDAAARIVASSADGEFARRTEGLDLRPRIAGGVDRRADEGRVRRLRELDLHQGSARELDALVDAVNPEKRQSGNDENGRDAHGDAPGLDEVVVRAVKNAQHDWALDAQCLGAARAVQPQEVEGLHDEDRRDERRDDTGDEGDGESLHRPGALLLEHRGRKNGRDVRVNDSGHRLPEALIPRPHCRAAARSRQQRCRSSVRSRPGRGDLSQAVNRKSLAATAW